MRTPESSPAFEQAVPRRHGVSLVFCCVALVAFSVFLIYPGIQLLIAPGGGYEFLASAVPMAAFLLLGAAGLIIADRFGREASIEICDGAVTLHSRGVLCKDVILPMTEITGVRSYPSQYASGDLPRGAGCLGHAALDGAVAGPLRDPPRAPGPAHQLDVALALPGGGL